MTAKSPNQPDPNRVDAAFEEAVDEIKAAFDPLQVGAILKVLGTSFAHTNARAQNTKDAIDATRGEIAAARNEIRTAIEPLATKDELQTLATKAELQTLENQITKTFATKDDHHREIGAVKSDLIREIGTLRSEMRWMLAFQGAIILAMAAKLFVFVD